MKPIPYGRQDITAEDIEAVVAVLQSDYLTQGPKIEEFEKAFAAYVGSRYAVAVSNGTAALHLGVMALGIKPGQKVITTPITFAASANAVRYCGGEVVFADIDPETYLIDEAAVRRLLEQGKPGEYAGILPVDFAGRPVNLSSLRRLAEEFGVWILEDACHSPGGFFVDDKAAKQNCGNGKFAELSVFSFHPVKHIACGEGGMITTDDERFYKKLLVLRTHGITRDSNNFVHDAAFAAGVEGYDGAYPGWYMEMQELGFNYRLTDMQAALGLSQLARAEEGLKRRREIACIYYDAFRSLGFISGQSGIHEGHAYHLYVIEVDDRLGLYNHLRDKGVFAQVHYIPVHLMPDYRRLGWKPGDFPMAEGYYRRCLSLPMYPTLTREDQAYVIDSIKEHFNG